MRVRLKPDNTSMETSMGVETFWRRVGRSENVLS